MTRIWREPGVVERDLARYEKQQDRAQALGEAAWARWEAGGGQAPTCCDSPLPMPDADQKTVRCPDCGVEVDVERAFQQICKDLAAEARDAEDDASCELADEEEP